MHNGVMSSALTFLLKHINSLDLLMLNVLDDLLICRQMQFGVVLLSKRQMYVRHSMFSLSVCCVINNG